MSFLGFNRLSDVSNDTLKVHQNSIGPFKDAPTFGRVSLNKNTNLTGSRNQTIQKMKMQVSEFYDAQALHNKMHNLTKIKDLRNKKGAV